MKKPIEEGELIEIWHRHAFNGGDVISFAIEVAIIVRRRTLNGEKKSTPPPSLHSQNGGSAT